MKKKLVYVSYDEGPGLAGVVRKIQGQCKAFEEAGIDVHRVLMCTRRVQGWKFLYRLPFTNVSPYWHWDNSFLDCDYIYIRYPTCINYPFLKLLREIKTYNKKVKIIVELHSGIALCYLVRNPKMFHAALKDFLCRKKLKKYVDYMTVLSNEKKVRKIYGIKTIVINNGFDFSTIRPRLNKSKKGIINLIAVSSMNPAHGYDRMIKGINDYYNQGGKRKIAFRIVGEGDEKLKYEKMIKKYQLSKHVKLYGYKELSEIQKLYDKSDIGVSALALHREGDAVTKNNVMKNKEYVAVGLPVVASEPTDLTEIDSLKKYVLEIPDNESPVNLKEVISFYDNIYNCMDRTEDIVLEIRTIGNQMLTYKKTMGSVIKLILGTKKG